MKADQRIAAFSRLGDTISDKLRSGALEPVFNNAYHENNWFIPENSSKALQTICEDFLDFEKISQWLDAYMLPEHNSDKTIGLVMAGNIPLVGWQDLQCVLMSGNKAQVKLSSKDSTLPKYLIGELLEIEPGFKEQIQITEQLKGFDAVIATGSANTMRYFEYYFAKYPHILRKNRNSVAVLSGNETREMLHALGDDIFEFFGLGCRNVSKLFVPDGYEFPAFFEAIEPFANSLDYIKYANNYNYNKSLLLLNKEQHLDNGFLLLKESEALATPVSVLNYQYYENSNTPASLLQAEKDNIQCIVALPGIFPDSVDFGQTQRPQLWDYADDVDVMRFLLGL